MSSKVARLIQNPYKVFYYLGMRGKLNWMPDKAYLSLLYRAQFGKRLNWKHPRTYNEKLNWIKLYQRKPLYAQLADKYAVRGFIKERIGEEYLIPLLGVWNSVDEIEWEKLPPQFVLKCTHDSGSVLLCTDKEKFDTALAKKRLIKAQKQNAFWQYREWPYKEIQPRIIAEQLMVDESGTELKDYKFFCFDGVVKAMFIATDRGKAGEDVKFDYYDRDFNHLDLKQRHEMSGVVREKPIGYEEMILLAEKLSKGFPQVRVDLYNINGRIYFGEMTFSHHAGLVAFHPEKWDLTFGEWIHLEGV